MSNSVLPPEPQTARRGGAAAPGATAGTGAPHHAGGSAPATSAAGSGSERGSLSLGGNSAPTARAGTAGGNAAPSMPPAVGGTGVAPAGGSDCRPAEYVRASLTSVDVTWPDTLGIVGGAGQIFVWSLLKVSAKGTTVIRPCGGQLPIMMTTAVAGGKRVLAEVPFSAFDSPNMPSASGTASWTGSVLNIDSGTLLTGCQLSDPEAPWPDISQTAQIMSVDSDGDGLPGVTAIPRTGDNFTLSPTSVLQNEYADGLFGAQRFRVKLNLDDAGCPDSGSGKAEIVYYDTRVIGCRLQGGGQCTSDSVQFINEARPIQTLGKATWTTKVLPDNATCGDVRAALPVPAQ